jgi:hypothetical protein
MNLFLWSLPLLMLLLSFISFKLNILKGVRYKFYTLVLFIAFLFDLMHLSFSNDILDTVRFLLVTFIIADILWNVTRMRKVFFKSAAVISGLIVFSWVYLSWVVDGPGKVFYHWKDKTISSYTNHKNRLYVLKEKFDTGARSVKRNFTLFKVKKVNILEEEVRTYTLPEGYVNSDFSFKWSNTDNVVRLDLINGKDTIWTLGEGF